nr:MAG TPA: portal protein [Caudoviricetes sp.]
MTRSELANKIWDDWQRGLNYQKKLRLKETSEQCVDFFEGRQWPQATEKTRNMPRPVINIIKYIVNGKKANILSSKISAVYKPLIYSQEMSEIATQGASAFTNFATHIRKEIKQEDLDDRAILDGLKKGTYIFHYFWDKESKTGMAKFDGGLNGQTIDLLNIVFANPKQKDEQKQKWIIIQSRENVQTLKKIAKKYGVSKTELELITADDDSERNYEREEQDSGEEYATVLTRYFRKNGEVYYIKSTRNMIVQPETPLTPDADKVTIEVDEENKTNEDTEAVDIDKPEHSKYKMTLYPIVVGNHEEREKSIYGIGEVEQLIPTQKSINFNYAMMQMASQNMGFPKVLMRPRALQGKQITNSPGEIITDYSPAFDGIRYLNPPAFSNTPLTVSDKLLEVTRVVTGATEVANGEVLGKNMSGSAIVALQTQAKVPIEDIQKRFWRVHEKIARIWEQFFKAYYTFDTQYVVENDNKEELNNFNGRNYQDIDFETTIDVGPGSAYSESLSINLLESALQRGDITFDNYIDLYPETAMPFKAKLKEIRKKQLLPPEISQKIAQNPQILQHVMSIIQQAETPAPSMQNSRQQTNKI